MALAEWVYHGDPPYDLWPVDIRRFGLVHRNTDWVRSRTLQAYARHYTLAWPQEEFDSARPMRRSPLYALLAEQGACFGEKLGWERPNWFADLSAGERAEDVYSFEKPGWHSAVAREHRAVRTAAVVIDQSSFAKFLLKGPDALATLDWLAANDVDKPVGSLVYTQLLDDKGGIQCDLTIARLAQDEFYIVTGTGFATHDFDWIQRNISPDARVQLVDITSSKAVLSLMGPKAREVLQQLSRDELSNEAFPFATCREIGVAGCPVLALRITYVGELGWELHVPTEFAVTLYQALMQAGQSAGLVNAGYRAIESCRLEKGYRAWGSDIGPDHTPLEAGLGWAVKFDRVDKPFKGRHALSVQRRDGVKKRLACFTVDDPHHVLLGRETILRNGKPVGWLSSAGYGHHVGKAIGYGYVRNEMGVDDTYILDAHYQLEVATELVDCTVQLKPLYDAGMQRVRG
jgi:4-methylaminobutanoate oxidase (formaldehyde-forming)